MRRFASPNKGLRSKTRAGKLCRSNGVGMSVAIDLAIAEAEPPTGGEAHTVLLCAVGAYSIYFLLILIIFLLLILFPNYFSDLYNAFYYSFVYFIHSILLNQRTGFESF
jgi:hypothetical protein